METLAAAGVVVGMLLMPILPYLTDSAESLEAVIRAARDHGAQFAIPGVLGLRRSARERFMPFLQAEFSALKLAYVRLYRQSSPPPDVGLVIRVRQFRRAKAREDQMYWINRSVAILKPKQSFLDWLNQVPDPPVGLTLEELRQDCTVILLPEYDHEEEAQAPRDVHKGNSWDIESYDQQGKLLRCIEVKGRGPEDANVVSLTEPEWQAARRLGEQHWLYIVRLGDGMMWMVQNPYAKLQPKELVRWVVKVKDAAQHGETVELNH